MKKNDNPKIVDEYIGSKPPEAQAKLQALRMILLDSLPDVREALRWGEPAILHPDGMILLIFAGYKQHMNLVATPSTKQAFAAELKGYKTGKGSVQFAYDKTLPIKLIKEIAQYRLKEYWDQGIKWM